MERTKALLRTGVTLANGRRYLLHVVRHKKVALTGGFFVRVRLKTSPYPLQRKGF